MHTFHQRECELIWYLGSNDYFLAMFQVPLGISISVGIKVGNQLGAGNPEEAMTTSRVAITMVCKYILWNHYQSWGSSFCGFRGSLKTQKLESNEMQSFH